MRLVDRLRRTDVAQLSRTVRSTRDQRDTSQAGLDHRAVQMGRRGTARRQHDSRSSRRQRDAQRAEPRGAFVVKDVHVHAVVGRKGERHGRRTRAGGDHRVGDAGPRPLVDEGGAERRLRRDRHPLIFMQE
jgi:hypothetical protein